MTSRGPLLTLLGVVVLAAGLLAVSVLRAPAPEPASTTAAPTVAPAAPVAPEAPPAKVSQQFPAEARYIGRTDGNGAAIAVTVRDGKVSAYLCDGKAVEGWFQGSAADGAVDAKGRGGNTLTGSLSGTTLSGTVSAVGRTWNYAAEPASPPAGLYRASTASGTAGWIKDADGRVTGLANRTGVVGPAPPLDGSGAQLVRGGE